MITVDDKGEENSRITKEAEFFRENLGNSVALEMVRIPSGKFLRGTKPQPVSVQSFWIGKYQVTQKQWREVANLSKVKYYLKPDPSCFKGDNRPVETVSWDEAVEFCDRLSQYTGRKYRLPSKAEWEYACRAGTKTPFYFGSKLTPKLARCKSNLGTALLTLFMGETVNVGQFLPNSFGLYDMHGNVWEWCEDDWHGDYNNAPKDGTAWLSGQDSIKVVRGGSWSFNPYVCRSAYRRDPARGDRFNTLGFHVVCVASRIT